MLVLAGDVGGTSTRLGYFEVDERGLVLLAEERYRSWEHAGVAQMVEDFAARHRYAAERSCFGVAGPILSGRVQAANLPWIIESVELARVLGLGQVRLINDLEANTFGISTLTPEDLLTLNVGVPHPTGTIAVVSPGTGLGESLAYWDGAAHRPLPSEAGHADFAPTNEIEVELLRYLQAKHGRVSYERVVSGSGLLEVYRFLRDMHYFPEAVEVISTAEADRAPAEITKAALAKSCPRCEKALDIFVSVFGSEAGNAALRFLATGGVYLGGGIPPKILDKLKEATFMVAFTSKGRLSSLTRTIPVHVILNESTALRGAARAAYLLAP